MPLPRSCEASGSNRDELFFIFGADPRHVDPRHVTPDTRVFVEMSP